MCHERAAKTHHSGRREIGAQGGILTIGIAPEDEYLLRSVFAKHRQAGTPQDVIVMIGSTAIIVGE